MTATFAGAEAPHRFLSSLYASSATTSRLSAGSCLPAAPPARPSRRWPRGCRF
jgi:hypothetical protein